MNTTPTQQPAPDYGEPWQLTTDFAFDITIRGELAASFDKIEHANRAVSCVNACAGMADPAKEIAALKQVGIANATMHLEAVDAAAEIAAMREAIREASQLLEAVDTGAQKDVNGVNWYDHRYITLAKLQPFIIP